MRVDSAFLILAAITAASAMVAVFAVEEPEPVSLETYLARSVEEQTR